MGDIQRKVQPGGSQEITATGTLVYVKETSAPFDIVVDGSERYRVQRGDKIRTKWTFSTFRIEDTAGAGFDCTLVVSSGDFSQSVIAQAVRVTNDGEAPLPVNIAGQSLPDRPYLRAKQTFAALAGGYDRFAIINPHDSGREIIDPFVSVYDNEATDGFSFGVRVAALRDGVTRADLPGQINAVSKCVTSEPPASEMMADRFNTEAFSDRSYIQADSARGVAGVCEMGCFATWGASHGGLIVGPGFAVSMEITRQSSDINNGLVFTWEWIEQPNDA